MGNGLFEDYNPITRLATNQHGVSTNKITKGSLISFHYPRSYAIRSNVIHDPYPMIIITDIWPKYIRGVNLHYLTFPYIKRILQNYGGNQSFSYSNIRPDGYMANAFRMYVRMGVLQPKRLDTEFLLNVLGSVRSFSPDELEKIRDNIRRQIQDRLQAKANELTSYEEWRTNLTRSQQVQLNRKVKEGQKTIQGGVDRNLIYPNEGPVGKAPASVPPAQGEGGPLSTNPNV